LAQAEVFQEAEKLVEKSSIPPAPGLLGPTIISNIQKFIKRLDNMFLIKLKCMRNFWRVFVVFESRKDRKDFLRLFLYIENSGNSAW